MVVGLLGNKSPDSNRLTLVTPKSENDVRLQAKLGNQNHTGLPVGVVSGGDSYYKAKFFINDLDNLDNIEKEILYNNDYSEFDDDEDEYDIN